MKLNEFKKPKLNELDLSSFIGDYGSAAARSGLGSLGGKNVLSTQDQMVKDQFVKNFTSRAFSGLQSGISSGLIDPNAVGQGVQTTGQTTPQTTQTTQQGQQSSTADTIAQKRIAAQKAQAAAIREPGASEGPKYDIDPNKQMSPYSKLSDKAPKTPEQIRQEKLAAATQSAQDQMNPMNKLPADQFTKSATNVRQQQQDIATQNAQDQMSPMSKLPADQFNKSAGNVRRRKQSTAIKPVKKAKDNTITMPRNSGKKVFGQMAQNLGGDRVAEGSRFDKLNYIFESILAEQDPEQGVTKQSISQYITNFFKQFMKGVNISDPTVMTQVSSLAKELEQTYNKDSGKSVLPKLAELGWSVQHAQAEEQPKNTTSNNTNTNNPPPPSNTTSDNTSGQKTKTAYKQIQDLLKDLTPENKQKILAALQKELANDSDLSVGGNKLDPNNPDDAKMIDMLKKQGKL